MQKGVLILKKRVKIASIFLIFLICLITIFSCYNCVLKGVSSGLYLCGAVIIPSLFPILCLTSFLSFCGVLEVFAKRLKNFSKKHFHLCGYFIPIFLLSMISGYPVGATLANSIYESGKISVNERNKIALICCSAGPAFVLLAVGVNIFNSIKIGKILFFSNLFACIVTALIVTRFFENDNEKTKYNSRLNALSDSTVFAVSNATSSVISICAFTIIFSAIVNVLTLVCANKTAFLAIVGFLEVTNGVFEFFCAKVALPFVCAVIGFGGLSVIFQISALLKTNRPPILKIIATRFLCACFSFIFCFLACKIFNVSTTVSNTLNVSLKTTSQNYYFSLLLWFLAIVFLSFLQKHSAKSKLM